MFKRIYETANLSAEQRKMLISSFRQHQLYHGLNYFKTSLKKLFQGIFRWQLIQFAAHCLLNSLFNLLGRSLSRCLLY
jgi:hypothetical protein